MTAMFVSYNSKSYHSAGRLRDQLAISTNLVDNLLCSCANKMTNMRYIFEEVDDKFIDIGANIDSCIIFKIFVFSIVRHSICGMVDDKPIGACQNFTCNWFAPATFIQFQNKHKCWTGAL